MSQPLCHFYKLTGRRAVVCEDVTEWGEWYARADRCVAETWIDDVRISTVFLAIDHDPFGTGDPVLFETMVFVNEVTHNMKRYFIWEEAEAGYAEMVEQIRAEMAVAQLKATAAWAAVLQRLSPE